MRFRPERPRRIRRRLRAQDALNPDLMTPLVEANRRLAAGDFAGAAPLYAELGQQAAHAGQFRRAVELHLGAAEAYARARDEQRTLTEAQAALAWLKRLGRDRRAARLGARIAASLRAAGLPAAADALLTEAANFTGSAVETEAEPEPAPAARGRLPTACPQCGAPVRSDSVEWIDALSAECAYCGATLAAA
ncbi:MAG: hypothetical protein JNK29_07280 [Anaerolineales bacterium]|nr:hypothetical protein [Anaerolineales bacterium]